MKKKQLHILLRTFLSQVLMISSFTMGLIPAPNTVDERVQEIADKIRKWRESGRLRLSEVILAAACLLAGGAGRLRWRHHTARDRAPCSLADRCTVSATRRNGGEG